MIPRPRLGEIVATLAYAIGGGLLTGWAWAVGGYGAGVFTLAVYGGLAMWLHTWRRIAAAEHGPAAPAPEPSDFTAPEGDEEPEQGGGFDGFPGGYRPPSTDLDALDLDAPDWRA